MTVDMIPQSNGGGRCGQTLVEQQNPSPCMGEKPDKENVGWRRIVRNFTPSWFAVNMGTGIVSVLLHELPYNTSAVQWISVGFFILNVSLFLVFTGITFLRYSLYPEIWSAMIRHPAQSLFLGCFPMGLATIINMTVLVCADWGDWVIYMAWGLWWLDVALSLACLILMPFPMMHHHNLELNRMTAALLFPFVPAVVASSSGGIVAAALPDPSHAATTLVASYIVWGMGEFFAMIVLSIYFHRLCVHSLPPREAIVSVFLPIGPLGQGGFGIQKLGAVARDLLRETGGSFGNSSADPEIVGEVFYALGIFLGFVMWGAGLCWLAFALISIAVTQSFPFNMGWWGFTFPLGVFATCTGRLAEELDNTFFRMLTMVFSISVVLLWLVVAVRTLLMAISGEIFAAPCLQDLRRKQEQAGSDRTA